VRGRNGFHLAVAYPCNIRLLHALLIREFREVPLRVLYINLIREFREVPLRVL
jgi:hypothetical protein